MLNRRDAMKFAGAAVATAVLPSAAVVAPATGTCWVVGNTIYMLGEVKVEEVRKAIDQARSHSRGDSA